MPPTVTKNSGLVESRLLVLSRGPWAGASTAALCISLQVGPVVGLDCLLVGKLQWTYMDTYIHVQLSQTNL